MKKSFILFISTCFISCSSNTNYTNAEDALDAVRIFKESCNNGNFGKAKFYCSNNTSTNNKLLSLESTYQKLNSSQKNVMQKESIVIIANRALAKDSFKVIITNFSNSIQDTFMVVNKNNTWLINL